jgi:hypothetical protein
MMATKFQEQFDNAEPFTNEDAPLPLRRELQEGDPYPVSALGPLLGDAVLGASGVIQAPLELCAQAALANIALAVQGHANVVMPFGSPRPTPISLFLLSIAESGDRKTQADQRLGGDAIAAFEQLREEDVRQERIAYHNAKEAHDTARSAAKSKAGKDGSAKQIADALDAIGDPPMEPLSATLTFSDPTIEGLHKQFSRGQPSAGLFSSEGGAFVGGFGMNAENALKTGALLSELWDGAPIKRLRSVDGESTIRNRRLCFHLMMQPGAAHSWLSNPVLRDQGLFSRLLVAAPKSLAGSRLWREPNADDVRSMRRLTERIGDILRHPLPVSADRPGELNPRPLEFEPNAARLFADFYNQIERQLGQGGKLESVRGLGSKTCEHAARIAAVLRLAADLNATTIDLDAMKRGVLLAQWYLGEALRLADAEAFPPDLLNAERVLEWLGDRVSVAPLFSLPCIYMKGPRPVRHKETAKRVVEVLLDHKQIEKVEGSHRIDGQTRRDCYRLRGA